MKRAAFTVMAILLIAAVTYAQSELVLDDFTTGKTKATLKSGTEEDFQNGSMIGGARRTNFIVAASTFDQPASFEIPKGGPLLHNAGIKVFTRLEVSYGVDTKTGENAPLGLNLSSYDRFRVNFDSNDLVLNFNILVFGANGGISQSGVNHIPNITATNVDFLFSSFTSNATPADFSNISFIVLIFQSGSAIGANDFAVTSFAARSGP